ncbi:hypothetical protein Tco_1360285 [Tanacetum coccineum]
MLVTYGSTSVWFCLRLVLPRSASDIVWLVLSVWICPLTVCCLSESAALYVRICYCLRIFTHSSPYLCDSVICTCLICSRSSSYLCDFVLCTCLICSRSSLYLYDYVLCTCLNLHLFGLYRNETPSNTESALWDASKLSVCLSVFIYFMFGKLSMFTTAALFLALGWHLEEIHTTWAHLEKKRTRLRLYTKYLETTHTERGDGVASIKRRRRDFQSDGVEDFVTASEHPFNVASYDGCAR